VLSKSGTRQGKVTRVSGALVTVEWDTGGQTTVIPAPGVMSVIGARAKTSAPAKKKKAPAKKAAPAKKKAAPAKKAVPIETVRAAPKKATKKKTAAKKATKKKAP